MTSAQIRRTDLWARLRASMCEFSGIDLDEHAENVARTLMAARGRNLPRRPQVHLHERVHA